VPVNKRRERWINLEIFTAFDILYYLLKYLRIEHWRVNGGMQVMRLHWDLNPSTWKQ